MVSLEIFPTKLRVRFFAASMDGQGRVRDNTKTVQAINMRQVLLTFLP
jgi:hypothetical protein